ncbi:MULTISPECIES: phosphoglycerate dehydrogenase [unclassified Rhizobium]|jgi:D-3-phosphoglycerate dehydrogenase|uniref:phosphoglycerate dehydrogenase n=1 Tax=unclassified Rhizobium TaxID=2613769 RepID=UPI0006491507|nr:MULTISPECIES: phosphoglycerate dehydrogenase [unclassified Rhizobium]MBN8949402.1 phosphoglycerate dehydrogenase [Rhizobium tropici]OJY75200.1 MAG: phosphoglycerate dehydrogenase [Rhizobium sp. 60-20]RKD70814.1 D-3-phosphoglycerate dehydrogenase [Rhizobium sp. WW_1]
MAPRVLVSDELSETAVQIFRDRGVEVDFQPQLGKDKDKLFEIIGRYDGLAIRSATKVTEKIIEAAKNLKVVGRAGIGVDNVDIPAASRRGIIVMNTPFGNSITTAEHAIALMFAVARQLPAADASTQAGKWEKSKFMGVEITGKTLGIIGAGNIGSIVIARALGLKMHVLAYDPFLSKERAEEMGVTKVELDELFARADFITLHVPLTDKTRNVIDASAIAKMKQGVRIINCARGGLVDEAALAAAIKSGHVAGAAFDVFEVEPAKESPLFGLPNVVCTPHLGASTTEAQENVALQVAEQMADYLVKGAVSNAINMPSITAEEAPILKPFIKLADVLGAFVGQVTEEPIKEIEILYDGVTANMNTKALTSALLAGLIRNQVADVNMVSAPIMIKEKGIVLAEVKRDKTGVYDGYIKLTVTTDSMTRSVAGTVFSDGKPRFIQIKGINLDADVGNHMVYIANTDVPGMIGFIGTALGSAGVNIANFQLGRDKQGGDAIALLYVDGPISDDVLAKLTAHQAIRQAKPLVFNVD